MEISDIVENLHRRTVEDGSFRRSPWTQLKSEITVRRQERDDLCKKTHNAQIHKM